MDRMLYVAMAAAKQTMQAQAVSANNLANINTTGFRKDLEASMSVHMRGQGYASRAYTVATGQGMDTSPSTILQTGNALDVAVSGKGWIAVQAANGDEAYTRGGDLQVDNNGLMTTSAGHAVLGEGGPITLPPFDKIEIAADGTVSILPVGAEASELAVLDRIRLVNPQDSELTKGEDGLIRTRSGEPAETDAAVQLVSGSLENSNVNGVTEMVRQIELARRFEAQIRLMSEAQDLDESTDRLLRNV